MPDDHCSGGGCYSGCPHDPDRDKWDPARYVHAPWNDDQVASLNAYQESGVFHPFTCGSGEEQVDLTATHDGWIARKSGPVVQTWAHKWMADWSWRA